MEGTGSAADRDTQDGTGRRVFGATIDVTRQVQDRMALEQLLQPPLLCSAA